MQLNLAELDKAQAYRLLTHTVTPRPIAWVLTEQVNGEFNLAPFSYFTVVTSEPPLMLFSVGHKRDGDKKDTWANLERTGRCVVHIAPRSLDAAVNETARGLSAEESEIAGANVSLVREEGFELPRVSEAPVAFDCTLHEIHEVGNGPQAVCYVEVKRAFIDDALEPQANGTLNTEKLNPLARLGGTDYSALGEIWSLARPE